MTDRVSRTGNETVEPAEFLWRSRRGCGGAGFPYMHRDNFGSRRELTLWTPALS